MDNIRGFLQIPHPKYKQSQTVTEYIYLSTVLQYNFEESALYWSIVFGEYSLRYSSTFERETPLHFHP